MKRKIGIVALLLCIASGVLVSVLAANSLPVSAHARDDGSGNGMNNGGFPTNTPAYTNNGAQQTTTFGSAVLVWDNKSTLTVVLTLSGLSANSKHAAHIHQGQCGQDGKIVQTLNPVTADGAGNAVVTSELKKVKNGIPVSQWYVNVHAGTDMKDANQMASISCGNVKVKVINKKGNNNNDNNNNNNQDQGNNTKQFGSFGLATLVGSQGMQNNGTSMSGTNATIATASALVDGRQTTILVTSNGLPLYYCLTNTRCNYNNWQALTTTAGKPLNLPQNIPGQLTIVNNNTNNTNTTNNQIAYNNNPLYTYSGDNTSEQGQNPVQPQGQGNGWVVVEVVPSTTTSTNLN